MMDRDKLPIHCIFCSSLAVALQQAFSNPANTIKTLKLPSPCKRTQFVVKLGSCKGETKFIQQMGFFIEYE